MISIALPLAEREGPTAQVFDPASAMGSVRSSLKDAVCGFDSGFNSNGATSPRIRACEPIYM